MRPWQPANGTDEPAPLENVGLAGGPCIYCQIDEVGGEREEVSQDEEEVDMRLRDLVLTPQDASTGASSHSLSNRRALIINSRAHL